MFFPIRTDYQPRQKPVVNHLLLAVNIALFFLGFNGSTAESQRGIWHLMLQPDAPEVYQFFTSMFLHANFAHLLGNMVFLWTFGGAINDRFGHAGYLAFYLAGGVLAGVGYQLLGGASPVLGASGAISAVTGAYLVLFPRTRVTMIVFFFFISFIEVSSLYLLAFQVILNLLMSVMPAVTGRFAGGVAYTAHASGYVFGIGISVILLATRVLPRDVFDLLNLIQSGRRRSQYRRMVAKGYDPFNVHRPSRSTQREGRRSVASKTVDSKPSSSLATRELELRKRIRDACARHDMESAAKDYLQLIQIADDVVLPRQNQLDVANQLMASQHYPAAADAYERFLRHYSGYEHIGDIYLMLGVLYGRYLHQKDRAIAALEKAVDTLHDASNRRLAEKQLRQLREGST
jgi:membrane associated rhomboid family serine protease